MAEISKTADQALTVLLGVGEHGPMTSATVARELNMNRSVAHRLLTTLHQRGFITRREDGFVAGATLLHIADRVQPQLRSVSREVILRLSEATGETVVLHIPDAADAVVLEQAIAHRHVVRVENQIGSRHRLSDSAGGRAILALQSRTVIDRLLRGNEQADTVRRRLDEVRRLGYAVSHDELGIGVHGLAAPVFDGSGPGHAIASIGIVAPIARAAALPAHVPVLLDETARVSAELSRTLARHETG